MRKLPSTACLAISVVALALGPSACSATNNTTTGTGASGGSGGAGGAPAGGSGGTGGTTQPDGGAGPGGFGGIGGTGGGSSSCEEDTKLMYLLGQGKELYKFNPATLMLLPVGTVNCPAGGIAAPFGMAIDRKGVAWVLYDNGSLFHVNTKDATCAPTGMLPGQQGFSTFGMGFVTDVPGGDTETLYITEADIFGQGTRLGKLDTTSLLVSVVGPYDKLHVAADATGTGDSKLFGFFRTSPVTIAEIHTANATILSEAKPNVSIGAAWAFATWGGLFWLFTAGLGQQYSRLDKFDMATGITEPVSDQLPFKVVGAGVSTCAPTKPPE